MNYLKKLLSQFENKRITEKTFVYPEWVAYEPSLIPPPEQMGTGGIVVIEEWFRWAEEWSLLLRLFGKISKEASIMEIGCGLGRIAFPLRYILTAKDHTMALKFARKRSIFFKVLFIKRILISILPGLMFITLIIILPEN